MALPLFAPGVKAMVTCVFPGVAAKAVGAAGGAEGVPVEEASAPTPLEFTARKRRG